MPGVLNGPKVARSCQGRHPLLLLRYFLARKAALFATANRAASFSAQPRGLRVGLAHILRLSPRCCAFFNDPALPLALMFSSWVGSRA
jgi:hypothetical protein